MLEEDATCVAFQAEISDPVGDDFPDIVVKFVARYGADVHKFLASEDHAPIRKMSHYSLGVFGFFTKT